MLREKCTVFLAHQILRASHRLMPHSDTFVLVQVIDWNQNLTNLKPRPHFCSTLLPLSFIRELTSSYILDKVAFCTALRQTSPTWVIGLLPVRQGKHFEYLRVRQDGVTI